jgi:hypothetical protein
MRSSALHILCVLSFTASPTSGDELQPGASMQVIPELVVLDGHESSQRLLVSLSGSSGRARDLTREATYRSLNDHCCTVDALGRVSAQTDGQTLVEVTVGDSTAQVAVTVRNAEQPRQPTFHTDVAPILSRFGCNSSACHGKAEGQNGFKLSVFGFDQQADYDALVREGRGRRVFPAAPDESLLLGKASGMVPHGGGARLSVNSKEYRVLRDWIAAGARWMPQTPRVVSIEVFPNERILEFESQQQLLVMALFDDGSRRDVTDLARFRSNNEGMASVDEQGLVHVGKATGHVAVMAEFLNHMDTLQILIPNPDTQNQTAPAVDSSASIIDRLVGQRLRQLNISPASLTDDATFMRRLYVDTIGTLPTAAETRQFLADDSEDKRAKLVEDLLKRPEYAVYWALRWSDILHVDRAVLGHRRAYAYYRWIRQNLESNRPMDEFARDITTASGFLDESPQGSFYQALTEPGARASAFSQVFLGIRIDCAECHHHPFDRWSQQDYYGMTAYFARVSTKPLPLGDTLLMDDTVKTIHPRTGEEVAARPLGASDTLSSTANDPRAVLAEWLTAADNPWFARNLANRTWAHFFGSGLVEPVDDVRQTNPSSNGVLLQALAVHLKSHDYDIKSLIRLIATSDAYQRATDTHRSNETDTQNASRAQLRPIPAEVLLDAISQTTGIPSQFDGVPAGTRAVELWDSKLQHPFLRLFGRPERKTACECERASEPSVSQVLHIMNSPEIFARLNHQGGTVSMLVREIPETSRLIEELYLTFLNRFPTDSERQTAGRYLSDSTASRRDAAVDLAWSLMNTLEFTFNH